MSQTLLQCKDDGSGEKGRIGVLSGLQIGNNRGCDTELPGRSSTMTASQRLENQKVRIGRVSKVCHTKAITIYDQMCTHVEKCSGTESVRSQEKGIMMYQSTKQIIITDILYNFIVTSATLPYSFRFCVGSLQPILHRGGFED